MYPATMENRSRPAMSHALARRTRQISAGVIPIVAALCCWAMAEWPPPLSMGGAAPTGRGSRMPVVWGNVVIRNSLLPAGRHLELHCRAHHRWIGPGRHTARAGGIQPSYALSD